MNPSVLMTFGTDRPTQKLQPSRRSFGRRRYVVL